MTRYKIIRCFGILSLVCVFLSGVSYTGELSEEVEQAARYAPVRNQKLITDVRVGLGGLVDEKLPWVITMSADNRTGGTVSGVWEIERISSRRRGRGRIVATYPMKLASPSKLRRRVCLPLGGDTSVLVSFRSGDNVYYRQVFDSARFDFVNIQPTKLTLLTITLRKRKPLGTFASKKLVAVQRANLANSSNEAVLMDSVPASGNWRVVNVFNLELNEFCAEPCEIPEVPVPIYAFGAVSIDNTVEAKDFTEAQMESLASYLKWGGCVVVDPANRSFVKEFCRYLPKSAALRLQGKFKEGGTGLDKVRIACGLVFVDFMGIYSQKGSQKRVELLNAIEDRPYQKFPFYVAPNSDFHYYYYYGWDRSRPNEVEEEYSMPYNAITSITVIGGLFLAYALFTGPVVWIFFRKRKRRSLAIYVIITILIFSTISLVTGAGVEMVPGDFEWTSVTEITPDGAVQYAVSTMTSSGGNDYECELKSDRIFTAAVSHRVGDHYRYSYYDRNPELIRPEISFDGREAFVGKNKLDTRFSIPPWGYRSGILVGESAQVKPLEVSLDMVGKQWVASVKNTFPCILYQPVLLVMEYKEDIALNNRNYQSAWSRRRSRKCRMMQLGNIESGSMANEKYPKPGVMDIAKVGSLFNPDRMMHRLFFNKKNPDDYSIKVVSGRKAGYCVSTIMQYVERGDADAYIVGWVHESPCITVGKTDFKHYPGFHYIVQPIYLDKR